MAAIATCFTVAPKDRHCTRFSFYLKSPVICCHPHLRIPFCMDNSKLKKTGALVCRELQRLRSSTTICRAGLESVRPGKKVESDGLASDVRNRAMRAIDSCGGRVTIGDVASKGGLKLDEAERALQALAADTGGFLEVSDEGDVLYVFPKDYRSKLAAKSIKMTVEPFLDKSKAAAEYVIRVSFGTALIASIVLVYTTIIALISTRSDEDNRGRRGGRSYDSGFTFFIRPSDLFWYWDPYYYRRPRTRKEDGMNFVESVGQYIASNGGVVTAEELAPFLDVSQTDESKDDESFMLPVLIRFDGHPEVDEEGNILYQFPSLQRTASSQSRGRKEFVGKRWNEWVGGVEKFFEEKRWQFSKIGNSEKVMVIGLGGLNLAGVIILGGMLKNITLTQGGLISFVTDVFPLLQIYAASFFAIPLFRWFLVRKRNTEIDKRNKAREQRSRVLEMPDLSLRRKLLSARDMAKQTVIGSDCIVYSTDKDFSEQDYEAKEWDRQFRELERSD
ncbi:hypothetical protein AMTRI_Chr11g153310 [Amborella trichopoda]